MEISMKLTQEELTMIELGLRKLKFNGGNLAQMCQSILERICDEKSELLRLQQECGR